MLVLASSLREFDISCKECYIYMEALRGKCILSLFPKPIYLRKDSKTG